MTLYFELISAQGALSRVALQPGVQRIKAAPGDRYRIYDDATGKTPPGLRPQTRTERSLTSPSTAHVSISPSGKSKRGRLEGVDSGVDIA